ncbi:MAG: porin family protein [Beijerinckiaceae bacterium]|nr:porin family protein [Beijerinckiaceae bacterium]
MFHKLLVSTVAFAALAGTAFAADLPSRHAPPVYAPPPIPVFTWTGIYVGGQVGYGFGRDSNNFNPSSSSTSGVIGGAHIGYNYQLPSNIVIGVEGDVDGSSARATTFYPATTASFRDEVQGSVRGRVGYAVDRALFYATGGAAFGGLRNNYYSGPFEDSMTHTRVGYTVGGGVEYAIDPHWSVRAEYRYTDFGHYNDFAATTLGTNITKHDTENRVQLGFSYKFDTFGPTPVVARY